MILFRYGLAMALVATLATSGATAERLREVDVCVDPITGLRLDDADVNMAPTAGDGFVAVGTIHPAGTIPMGGVTSCDDISDSQIGTFFTQGRFVADLPPGTDKIPAAGDADIAYALWQFRIDGQGAWQTMGLVQATSSFSQTIIGASGRLRPQNGRAIVEVLNLDGFQIRVFFRRR